MELFDKNIGATFLQLIFRIHEIEKQLSEKEGLTIDEMRCLMTVFLSRPSCVSDLNSMLEIEPTRTSKVLNSLQQQGFIRREMDTYDHRKSRIEISESGRVKSEKILLLSNEFFRNNFSSMPEEMLFRLDSLLHNIK